MPTTTWPAHPGRSIGTVPLGQHQHEVGSLGRLERSLRIVQAGVDTSGVGQRLRVGDCRRGSLEETGIQEPPAYPRVLADGIGELRHVSTGRLTHLGRPVDEPDLGGQKRVCRHFDHGTCTSTRTRCGVTAGRAMQHVALNAGNRGEIRLADRESPELELRLQMFVRLV